MSDADVGMIAVGADSILVTVDTGRTWRRSLLPTLSVPYGVAGVSAPAPGTFVILCTTYGDSTFLFRTDDTGRTWQRMPSRDKATNIFFIDALHGWIASRARIEPNGELSRLQLAYTRDGAQTWETMIDSDLNGQFWSVFVMRYRDTLNGIISDYSNAVRRTTDGGRTWVRDSSADYAKIIGLSGLEYLSPTRILGTSSDGKIYIYDSSPEASVIYAQAHASNIRLIPNPVDHDGFATLTMSFVHGGHLDISVVDLMGREVADEVSRAIEPGEINIPLVQLSGMPSGAYIVRISLDGVVVGALRAVVR